MNYQKKYLKYKQKYLNLKKQFGGHNAQHYEDQPGLLLNIINDYVNAGEPPANWIPTNPEQEVGFRQLVALGNGVGYTEVEGIDIRFKCVRGCDGRDDMTFIVQKRNEEQPNPDNIRKYWIVCPNDQLDEFCHRGSLII